MSAVVRWLRLVLSGAVVAAAMAVASPALASGTTQGAYYSFVLAPPNTAVSPSGGAMSSPGDWISVKGSGTFDPVAETVAAQGTFVHYNSAGVVVCKGTWKATGITSFTYFGTNEQGQSGGTLSIVVTHYCKTMNMVMTGIPMTVTSTVDAPSGGGYVEGTSLGDFTEPTGGTVTIEPEP